MLLSCALLLTSQEASELHQNRWRDSLACSGLQIGVTTASSMVDLDLLATSCFSRDKADVDRDF
jgi:hypothetical protein